MGSTTTPLIDAENTKATLIKALRSFDNNRVPRAEAREKFGDCINSKFNNDKTFNAFLKEAKRQNWVYTDRSMGVNYITIASKCPDDF